TRGPSLHPRVAGRTRRNTGKSTVLGADRCAWYRIVRADVQTLGTRARADVTSGSYPPPPDPLPRARERGSQAVRLPLSRARGRGSGGGGYPAGVSSPGWRSRAPARPKSNRRGGDAP